MTIFKDFSANGELMGSRDEPINEANGIRFIKEFGSEQAKGYAQALADILKELEDILNPADLPWRQTPPKVRTNLNLYVSHKKVILEKLSGFVSSSELDSPKP